MDEWIVDVISFQKIFGLCGLKCHIVEIWRDVTFLDGRRTDGRTECEDRARILETEFALRAGDRFHPHSSLATPLWPLLFGHSVPGLLPSTGPPRQGLQALHHHRLHLHLLLGHQGGQNNPAHKDSEKEKPIYPEKKCKTQRRVSC